VELIHPLGNQPISEMVTLITTAIKAANWTKQNIKIMEIVSNVTDLKAHIENIGCVRPTGFGGL
jgi:hypothetical protein